MTDLKHTTTVWNTGGLSHQGFSQHYDVVPSYFVNAVCPPASARHFCSATFLYVLSDSHPALPLPPPSHPLCLSPRPCVVSVLLSSLISVSLPLSFHLPGPGFVESAFLSPLDLAGLEHMQSAFSLYRRYGMTSHCEYSSSLPVSCWLVFRLIL